METLIVIGKLGLIILGADFLTGIAHWWEDAYGNPDWKFLGASIVKPNLEHHRLPRKFLQNTFIDRVRISVLVAIGLCVMLWALGWFRWELGLLLAFASMGNEVHAMAHRTDKENGRLIVALQKIGLLQSRRMHGHHHKSPYNVNYCILTNYLNPLLNAIKFWNGVEWLLEKIGITHSRNLPQRGGY